MPEMKTISATMSPEQVKKAKGFLIDTRDMLVLPALERAKAEGGDIKTIQNHLDGLNALLAILPKN